MRLFIRRCFALRSIEPSHYLTRLPAGLELASQEEALLMIRCYLPPLTADTQVADRALCHTLLECAIPIIYAGKPKGQVVTPEWLAGRLGPNHLINSVTSRTGPRKFRMALAAWLLSVPGASERALASGSLPSVFHGKYRSIIKDILEALEHLPPAYPSRAAA